MSERSDTPAGTPGGAPVPPPARPLLSVVRGEPSPEQLAALIAVLASRGETATAAPAAPRLWRTPLRPPMPAPGLGTWRASALPR